MTATPTIGGSTILIPYSLKFALLVIFISGCDARVPQSANDPSLYGTWHVVRTPEGRNPSEIGISVHWTFDKSHITVTDGKSGETISQSTYRVDATASPKRIDMLIDDIEKEIRPGLYRIRNGKLQIMFNVGGGSRPVKLLDDEAMVFVRDLND